MSRKEFLNAVQQSYEAMQQQVEAIQKGRGSEEEKKKQIAMVENHKEVADYLAAEEFLPPSELKKIEKPANLLPKEERAPLNPNWQDVKEHTVTIIPPTKG